MKIIKTGLLLSALSMSLLNCKTAAQKTSITSVSYTHTAGRGGASSVTATKDSLESSARGGRFEDFPKFKKKIQQKDWEKIISGLDVITLEKTKNGERRGLYDGPDEIFRITTGDKEYEIINAPSNSEGYKQLEKLKTDLNNLLPQYK